MTSNKIDNALAYQWSPTQKRDTRLLLFLVLGVVIVICVFILIKMM